MGCFELDGLDCRDVDGPKGARRDKGVVGQRDALPRAFQNISYIGICLLGAGGGRDGAEGCLRWHGSCKLFHRHVAQVVATKDMVAPGWWSGNLAPMEPKLSCSAHKFLKDVSTTPVLKFDAAMIGHGNVHVVDQEDLARILDLSHGGWLIEPATVEKHNKWGPACSQPNQTNLRLALGEGRVALVQVGRPVEVVRRVVDAGRPRASR